MALINCEECGKEISDKASACPHCGVPIQNEVKPEEISKNSSNNKWAIAIFLAMVILIAFGMLRIYTGGGIGLKVTTKASFSFTDTFINMDDDVFGKPRMLFANEHPAVKKQLEEMGILETDEQVQDRVEAEMKVKQDEIMRDMEMQQAKMMHQIEQQQAQAVREYNRQMRQLGY